MAEAVTWKNLGAKMLEAAKAKLGGQPEVVKRFLKAESQKLAVTLTMIAEGLANKEITADDARILVNQQKVAASAVLTASAGMTAILAQNAINAALDTARKLVNGKLGFSLL